MQNQLTKVEGSQDWVMAKNSEIDSEIIERAIKEAIYEYQNFDGEDYIGNRAVFILWQHLGGIDMPNGFALLDYKPIVRKWYELSEGRICDENGELLSFTEVWAQFVDVCGKDRVKHFRRDYLELAKSRVKEHPQILSKLTDSEPQYQYLGAVCHELQQITGENVFWLSGYDAGEIIGKSQKSGRLALDMFVAEGVLKRTKVGNRHDASEYRCIDKPVVETKSRNKKVEKMINDLMLADKESKASRNR